MADLRSSGGGSHVHSNPFYESRKHNGPLLPPAAALAPTVWPQFHLRWACPLESQVGELEAQCRNMNNKLNELQRVKEEAEVRARETAATLDSVISELQREKMISNSAMEFANQASKETAAIKRGIQSLGCKVHLSGDGECSVTIGCNPAENFRKPGSLTSRDEADGSGYHNAKSEAASFSGSVSIYDSQDNDDSSSEHPVSRVCESLCPLRNREGGCRWPEAGCAQLGSQFVGLKANFDAFDRLSIYDSYFQPE